MNSTSNSHKVLVVDDDPLTLELMARSLAKAGFTPTTALSGEDALACLWSERFDAVISDVIMPGMSGFELLRNIRSSRPGLPVILMSSLDREHIRSAATVGGAVAVFEKPLDRAALVAALETAISTASRLSPTEDAILAVPAGR